MAVTVYVVNGTVLTEAEYVDYLGKTPSFQEALKISGLDWQVESE